jgi:rhodanese-related sulfurtransferase
MSDLLEPTPMPAEMMPAEMMPAELSDLTEITVDQVAAMVAAGASLVDVREIDEWMAGHAAGAVHVPLLELPDALDRLPRDRRVLCVCRSGNRSGRAVQFLRPLGIDAVNVLGGMTAWALTGHPLERPDGRPGTVI